jgi:hypothetical protein
VPRPPQPARSLAERRCNFCEVALGYTQEQARLRRGGVCAATWKVARDEWWVRGFVAYICDGPCWRESEVSSFK